jgi:hypothetical protein
MTTADQLSTMIGERTTAVSTSLYVIVAKNLAQLRTHPNLGAAMTTSLLLAVGMLVASWNLALIANATIKTKTQVTHRVMLNLTILTIIPWL